MKSVLFDFGDTLFEPLPRSFEAHNLQRFRIRSRIPDSQSALEEKYRENKRKTAAAFSTRKFYLHEEFVHKSLLSALDLDQQEALERHVETFVADQRRAVVDNLKPRADLIPLFLDLRRRGMKIGIVSNIDNSWFDPLIKRFNLSAWTDLIVSSETARSCKPDSKIFIDTCNALQVQPEECVFVGDSEINDVRGANQLSMRTVCMLVPGASTATEADYSVRSLTELIALLPDLLG